MNPLQPRKFTLNTQAVVFLVAIALWMFLSYKTSEVGDNGLESRFLNGDNVQNIMRQMAIQGVIGVGAVLVILTGGIDLSVGSLIAVVNVAMAMLLKNTGMPMPAVIAIVLLISVFCGLCNGVMIYDFKLPPFIATLAMMTILRGGAQLVSEGRTIFGLPNSLRNFASADVLGIPALFWVLIFVVIIIEFILRKTSFGRYTYAIGSNPEAARLSGVDTRMVTYGVYMLASLLGGIAGCMQTARDWQGNPTTGTSFELDAIAAAVLGGASLMGAEGNAIGAFIGALLMTTIYNGSVLMGIDSNWTKVIVGAILAITVAVDQFRKRRSGD
jgi:ribose transport system permease protein